jgi:general secretion pathway protein K
MRREPAWQGVPRRYRGFALLIVLWTLVLVAFIVAHVTAAGRSEVRIAGNLAANAAAQAAADGAIYQAIFNLANPQPDRRWPLDGAGHQLRIGDSLITVIVEDESGRVNPNLASEALLEGLLRAVGDDSETTADLAGSITEWVGSAQVRRTPDKLTAEYRAAGLDYDPPGAPLESLDELGRVRGMTTALLDALRPHLTLFGQAEPNPAAADKVVATAIALANRTSVALGAGQTSENAPGDIVTARIRANAQGPSNARVSRVAIARIGPFSSQGYTLLAWDNGVE